MVKIWFRRQLCRVARVQEVQEAKKNDSIAPGTVLNMHGKELSSILWCHWIKTYPDLASTQFRIHSVFKNFHSGERIKKVADHFGFLIQRCKALIAEVLFPVHTYPFLFENNDIFSLRFGLPYTRIRRERLPKTHLFKNALQNGDFWKRRLFVYVWTDQKRGFRIR